MNSPDRTIDEHFWFTATTIGFNFVIIDKMVGKVNFYYILAFALLLNVYAIFLILHRSAAHSHKIRIVPNDSKGNNVYIVKLKETKENIKAALRMIPLVIIELSGALFYILLIMGSFLGILLSKH